MMTIRWFKSLLAVMITSVALVGCGGGNAPVEPEPSTAPAAAVEGEEGEEGRPEATLEEGGADAGLPPDQQTENEQN